MAGLTLRRRAAVPSTGASGRRPGLAFGALSAVLAVTGYVANTAGDGRRWWSLRWPGWPTFLSGWIQFDGVHYVDIARSGYSYRVGVQSTVVWFPLYPLVLRVVEVVTGDFVVAGVVVTWVGGLATLLLMWRWLPRVGVDAAHRPWCVAVLFLYPYAWFLYGPVYSDSLFVALVIGAFLLVEAERPAMATLVAIAATATRSMGPLLVPALVLLGLERSGALTVPADSSGWVRRWALPVAFDRSRVRRGAFAPLLGLAGVGGYMVYLWHRFGDPIAFVTNQSTYHHGKLPLLKPRFFVIWRDAGDMSLPLTLTAQALFAAFVIWSVPAVGRRFGWGYAVFVLLVVGLPMFTSEEFMGIGRYLLAVFPVAALVGERLAEHRRAGAVWLAVSAIALIGLNMGFSRSWYLS